MEKINGNCVVVRNNDISTFLHAAPVQGKHMFEPLKVFSKASGIPLNFLEDTDVSNDAEVHRHEADLWYCLEGEVEFICGGELVEGKVKINKDSTIDDREWKAKAIEGGEKIVLRAGDWLWIPAGEPHQHSAKGTAKLAIIKVPRT